jgi:hypothetical protein
MISHLSKCSLLSGPILFTYHIIHHICPLPIISLECSANCVVSSRPQAQPGVYIVGEILRFNKGKHFNCGLVGYNNMRFCMITNVPQKPAVSLFRVDVDMSYR